LYFPFQFVNIIELFVANPGKTCCEMKRPWHLHFVCDIVIYGFVSYNLK
jgi:hypothetical protein